MIVLKLCIGCFGFPGGSVVKNPPANAGDVGSIPGSNPWVGKMPWRRKWQHTPVFLTRNSHGPRGAWWTTVHGITKELDMT